jgi:XapX domain-containing protein
MATTPIGLIVGFLIGAGCRYFDIPSLAPPRPIGAFLLVAMTIVAWLDLRGRRCTFFGVSYA